ncbi:MAG: hypothetical protein WBC91_23860 [Phototrophicaceae bacterium]
MVTNLNQTSRIQMPDSTPSSFWRLWCWLMNHGWYVHETAHIQARLTPAQVYKILETAAKPSVNRLGLRKLFKSGRRYFIRARNDGSFQMMTTSRVWWHPKRRTQPTAILSAAFDQIDEQNHRLHLRSRIKLRYLLEQFFIPTFMTSIIIYLGWSPIFLMSAIVGLYGLSWTSHRLTAMIESHEITFFIETVLDDFAPEAPQQLATGDADVTISDDFVHEWDRYVDEKI